MKNKLHKILALGFGFALCLSGLGSANAYNTFGCKWQSNKVLIQSAKVPAGYSPSFAASMADWTSTDMDFVSWSGSNPNVFVDFPSFGNVNWDGMAAGSDACAAGIYKGTIRVMINRHFADKYSANTKQGLFSHELGHAIGIAHSGYEKDECRYVVVMNPHTPTRSGCSVYLLKADDKAAANKIY